jgi:hypothetical protein
VALRYDPNYNVVAASRPVVERFASRLLGAAAADPKARLADWGQELAGAARTARELVRRIERDELRVRSHPQDAAELRQFLSYQVRRALLALFAFTCAILSALVWMATRQLWILLAGLALSFGFFFVILVLPAHLFQNPLRFRRAWPDR